MIDGAVMGVIDGGVGAAPAGPEPAASDAIVPRNPSASTAPATMRRRVPVVRVRVLVLTVTADPGSVTLYVRAVLSRSWSSIAFHDGVGPVRPLRSSRPLALRVLRARSASRSVSASFVTM